MVESRDGKDERRARRGPDMRLATSLGQGEAQAHRLDTSHGFHARPVDGRRRLPLAPSLLTVTSRALARQTPSMLKCTIHASEQPRIIDGRTQWKVLSAAVNNPTCAQAQGGTHGIILLSTIAQSSSVLIGVGSQESLRSRRTSNWRSHASRMVPPADGPSPQKGRRCSPGSV